MNIALRLAHAAFALALLGWLVSIYVERHRELAKVREVTASEHAETERLQRGLDTGTALRDGLKRDDPYVIELLARDRHQYTGSGELSPPPRPAAGK